MTDKRSEKNIGIIKRNSSREFSYGAHLLLEVEEKLSNVEPFCEQASTQFALAKAKKVCDILLKDYQTEEAEKAYIDSRVKKYLTYQNKKMENQDD